MECCNDNKKKHNKVDIHCCAFLIIFGNDLLLRFFGLLYFFLFN